MLLASSAYHVDMDRSQYPTSKRRLEDPEDASYVRGLTPAERVMMVWTLTRQAWEFMEGGSREPRLRRHVVRVVRGQG